MIAIGGWKRIAQELTGILPIMASTAAKSTGIGTKWTQIDSGAGIARLTGITIVTTRMIIRITRLQFSVALGFVETDSLGQSPFFISGFRM
jgi:hypothetical protein